MASEGIGAAEGWLQVLSEDHPKGPRDLHLFSLDVPVGGEDGDGKKSPTTSQRRVGKQFLKTAEAGASSRQPLDRSTGPGGGRAFSLLSPGSIQRLS